MKRPRFRVEERDPTTLTAHPENFRRHPESQTRALRASVDEHGWLAAPLWNARTNHLLDGHARVELAVADGEESLPVNVIDVSPAQERRILRSFDAITSLALVDDAALDALIESIDDAALEQLLGSVAEPESGLLPGADPDALPEAVETRCKAGDLWRLGDHRLGCLDCREESALLSLLNGDEPAMIFADPPYGINIVQSHGKLSGRSSANQLAPSGLGTVGGSKPFGQVGGMGRPGPQGGYPVGGSAGKGKPIPAGQYPEVIGDESTETAVDAFRLCESRWPRAVQIWWGGNHYAGYLPCSSAWIVWDKENTGSFGDAELAWTNQKKAVRVFRHMWNGLMKASERGEKRVHPTQKPVALAEWCYQQCGAPGDLVLDPFAGSGMSLIAAESMGRRWCGAELSPEYCDVILARWEQATGKVAERL